MALTPGFRRGPYEIVAALGEGGMGEVYKARIQSPALTRKPPHTIAMSINRGIRGLIEPKVNVIASQETDCEEPPQRREQRGVNAERHDTGDRERSSLRQRSARMNQITPDALNMPMI